MCVWWDQAFKLTLNNFILKEKNPPEHFHLSTILNVHNFPFPEDNFSTIVHKIMFNL